jgi:predicted TIM-barrel fold metal-dependent hydrolase
MTTGELSTGGGIVSDNLTKPWVIDADNHLYEQPEALTKYLPALYQGAVKFVTVDGRVQLSIQNRINDFIPNPTFSKVAAPGRFMPYFTAVNPEGLTMREMAGTPIVPPPAVRDDPAARLALLDDQGIHKALIYPTLAGMVDSAIRGEPDLNHALIHAINEWLLETWSFNFDDRLFVTPVICMSLVDEAIREFEWAVDHGAKVALIMPLPPEGRNGHRSFALPEFDPFWRKVEDSGLPVAMHGAYTASVEEYLNAWEPPSRTVSFFTQNTFRAIASHSLATEDTFLSLICHGALSRFPGLRIASVENGADWVPYLLRRLEKSFHQSPKSYVEDPVEVFRRNVFVHPFWEDDLVEIIDAVGNNRVLFGSDYPHPEGLPEPLQFVKVLEEAGIGERDTRRILHDNAAEFLGSTAP